jgi:CYTH domain-containing protein
LAQGREIERKFLVSAIPEEAGQPTPILQGYLPLTSDDAELRVRRKGDATVLTVKHGHGLDRGEQEVAISEELFDALWPLTEGRRIEKRRYEIPHAGATIELDEFGGELEGLLLAEVEFDSVEASDRFDPPGWLERDVTGNPAYSNRALAERSGP